MRAEDRYLRVYCLTHAISFTAPGAGAIVCAGGGEPLARDFPYEEFWEYCCDCQSFRPSHIAQGGKAQERCAVCSRIHTKRYACNHCKVISLDSDEETKRKAHRITGKGGVEPSCPGCLKTAPGMLSWHQCDEIAAQFSTALATCPFCHEQLAHTSRRAEQTERLDANPVGVVSASVVGYGQSASSLTCPRCGTTGTPENRFCKECGSALGSDAAPQGPAVTAPVPPPRVIDSSATPTLPSTVPSVPYYVTTPAATGSGQNYTEAASTSSATRPLLVAALVLALLVIGVLSVILLQANSRREAYANANKEARTIYSTPTPMLAETANASKKSSATTATPASTPTVQPSPALAQSGPTANARLAYCRSNNVYVRSSPYLDESKANVIKVINRDQRMWVLSTSSNYDTTYIRSAGGDVTDNWTEVQLYDDASVRGWVFSYFVQY